MTEVQVFRRSGFNRLKLAVGFTAAIMFGPLFAWMLLPGVANYRLSEALLGGTLLTLVFGLAPVMPIVLYRQRIRLCDDRIEWRQFFRTNKVRRADITAAENKASHVRFRLTSGRLTGFSYRDIDDAAGPLEQWLAGLPDLQDLLKSEEAARLMSNPALGTTTEDRFQRLSKDKSFIIKASCLSLALSAVAVLVGGKVFFLILLALAPLTWALPYLSYGRWILVGYPGDSRREVGHIALWPTIGAGWVAYNLFEPINEAPLLLCSIGLAAIFLWALGLFRPHLTLLCSVPAALTYSFAVFTAVNGLLPPTSTERYETVIVGKVDGRKSNWLQLAPWGPVSNERSVSPRGLFYAVEEGDVLCMTLYTGTLGWQYYDYALCQADRRRGTQ